MVLNLRVGILGGLNNLDWGMSMKNVIIVGAGASGIIAAYFAEKNGANVTLIEKNKMIGRKLRITGKGRCNITNASDLEDIIKNIYKNGNFMYSSLYSFTNYDMMDLLERNGLKIKVERGNRVFPESDLAIDVVRTLEKMISNKNIKIIYNKTVKKMILDETKSQIRGVKLNSGEIIYADSVVVSTGGMTYPLTGSTGDGYRFARDCNHEVTELYPALVGMETKEVPAKEMVGFLLKNISIKLLKNGKKIYEEQGELEFRDYGIDGALVKRASSLVRDSSDYKVILDLKPALSREKLDMRIQRDFSKNMNISFKKAIKSLLPSNLLSFVLEKSDIDSEKVVHQIKKEERLKFVDLIKNIEFNIKSLRPMDEGIVTSGGVSIKEINPQTMESKLVKGLYFSGEVIDVEGYTGGYNLQIAFSTGYLAGVSASV